jgi:hypothetical protein
MKKNVISWARNDPDSARVAGRPLGDYFIDPGTQLFSQASVKEDLSSQPAQRRRLIKDTAQASKNLARGVGNDIMRDGAHEAKLFAFFAGLNHRRNKFPEPK